MTFFATGSSPNSVVSHIMKSSSVGFYSSPASPRAPLSFLCHQCVYRQCSLCNDILTHPPLHCFQYREADGYIPRLSSSPLSEGLVSPLRTPAHFSKIGSITPTYSEIPFKTLFFCLRTPTTPHPLPCAASEPVFLL